MMGRRVYYSFDEIFYVRVVPFCRFCGGHYDEEDMIEDDLPDTEVMRWRHESCSYTALGAPSDPKFGRWYVGQRMHTEEPVRTHV